MDSRRVSRAPRYSGVDRESKWFSSTRLSRSMVALSRAIRLTIGLVTQMIDPTTPTNPEGFIGLGSSAFARHY